MSKTIVTIPAERVEKAILQIRGERVILDSALAELYCVETRSLIQAVKRNRDRFPPDFVHRRMIAAEVGEDVRDTRFTQCLYESRACRIHRQ